MVWRLDDGTIVTLIILLERSGAVIPLEHMGDMLCVEEKAWDMSASSAIHILLLVLNSPDRRQHEGIAWPIAKFQGFTHSVAMFYLGREPTLSIEKSVGCCQGTWPMKRGSNTCLKMERKS